MGVEPRIRQAGVGVAERVRKATVRLAGVAPRDRQARVRQRGVPSPDVRSSGTERTVGGCIGALRTMGMATATA